MAIQVTKQKLRLIENQFSLGAAHVFDRRLDEEVLNWPDLKFPEAQFLFLREESFPTTFNASIRLRLLRSDRPPYCDSSGTAFLLR